MEKDVQGDVDAEIKDMDLIKVEENKVAEIRTEVKDSLMDAEVKADNAVENAMPTAKTSDDLSNDRGRSVARRCLPPRLPGTLGRQTLFHP